MVGHKFYTPRLVNPPAGSAQGSRARGIHARRKEWKTMVVVGGEYNKITTLAPIWYSLPPISSDGGGAWGWRVETLQSQTPSVRADPRPWLPHPAAL